MTFKVCDAQPKGQLLSDTVTVLVTAQLVHQDLFYRIVSIEAEEMEDMNT